MGTSKASDIGRRTARSLNRKQRKELGRRLYSDRPGLEVVHRNVAGIDVGNASHYVAVAPERDPQPVREFGSWTASLHAMADWLESLGIEHVVMQSTGVYWIGVYEVLEKRGFEVCLANARDTRNLPGRKSDVQESQWLLKLHSYGLLRNSFRPPEQVRRLRAIWRLRDRHVREAGREIQHMQKALTTMNVQLANVISDLSGLTGQSIVRAILQGERDPGQLARMRDPRIKASAEEIARSLEGTWQEEVLFELQQAVDRYDFCYRQIRACDEQLKKYLAEMPTREVREVKGAKAEMGAKLEAGAARDSGKRKKKKVGRKARKNEPHFDLEGELVRICGVRLTAIEGVDVTTVQTWVSELGVDMRPWPSGDHLVSWLNLSPKRQISGGKLIRHERSREKNRVANALRMAATTLLRSDSYLGARYRHLRTRLGACKAVKAMAAYLARLIYAMLTRGEAWVDRGAADHQQRRQEREHLALQRKALAMGFRLVAAE